MCARRPQAENLYVLIAGPPVLLVFEEMLLLLAFFRHEELPDTATGIAVNVMHRVCCQG